MIYTEFIEKIRNNEVNLGIIGLGYVGLPLAIHFKELGCSVHGFDIDEDKINKLNNGKSYINHIKEKDIEKLIQNGNFSTSDFSKFQRWIFYSYVFLHQLMSKEIHLWVISLKQQKPYPNT